MITPNCLHFLYIADYFNQIGVNNYHLINLIMIIITTIMIRPALIRVFCSSTCQGQRMVGLTDKHVCYSHLTSHALAATALRKYFSFTSNIFVQTMLMHISLSMSNSFVTHTSVHIVLLQLTNAFYWPNRPVLLIFDPEC